MLYTNHLPRVGTCDVGTWWRLIVIPFNAKISGGGDVKNYADHLVESAGPAIMAWIIEGARIVIEEEFRLIEPEYVRKAINTYRENNDWIGNFLGECCEVNPGQKQKSGELYQEYRSYCARNGEFTRNTSDFYTALENMGFERKKTSNGNLIVGLRLKDEEFLD